MKTVGVLGGGQLGCMLADALFKLGAKVQFYDPDPTSPAYFRTQSFVQGGWEDKKKLEEFFATSDIVTYEFENVSVNLLEEIVQKTGTQLFPSAQVLATTQNRYLEKTFLKNNDFPVCQFALAKNIHEANIISQKFNFPYIIKTATGGYDGKGQWLIKNKEDFESFIKEISIKFVEIIFEEKIQIELEASCIVARNSNNKAVCLPVFENVHKNHILYNTTLPAHLPISVQEKLKSIALKAANKLNVTGLLTTEFFLSRKINPYYKFECIEGYYIYINEFAPRPHNSGHISLNACNISQFNALAHILLNIPLQTPKLNDGFYCMGNLLGDTWIEQGNKYQLNLNAWEKNPEVIDVVLYGKSEAKKNRKMGHFVTHSLNREQSILDAEKFRSDLNEKL
ncbi:5-(carboxyamino)imidazole ribonucleotide synthase [Fluviispira multicolorata]|uniref:N5-carboxyaminoimidazole ribonucleotide synthase n=1 Tax=Fluviispira multicolorata TaxID=2654512 RepID=A0A833JDZ3_9BACT|nr:ATP-grasp domain-containing protein [Fluviispira multicolorata]KAB8032128.1 ATP-grasp domain-containing protein [Fluviispira multicolorata]